MLFRHLRAKTVSTLLGAVIATQTQTPTARADLGESSFRLDSAHYLYGTPGLPSNDYESLQLHVQGQTARQVSSQKLETKADVQAMLMLASRDPFYFEAPELYAGLSSSSGSVQIRLGRKLETWNQLDDLWQLGIWQPRFRWDYFHPEEVGMTGAFFSYERGSFRLTAFATPVSIPERGVPTDDVNGKLSSPLRWFSPPPASIEFNGSQRPVYYGIQTPDLGALILNPGAGVTARLGGKRGWWSSASYAYQPINQPILAYDGYFTINPSTGDSVSATVYPRILYHHLLSVDAGFEQPRWSGWISLLAENPVNEPVPATWTQQMLAPSRALSAAYDFHWGDSSRQRHLGVSYLRQQGGNLPDSGPFASPDSSVFESRYPYQSALMLTGGTPFLRKMQVSSKLIYDLGHGDIIWSPEISYAPTRSFAVDVGADLLSAGFGDSTELAGDFIDQNRVNSRLRGGVTYVF